MEEFTVQIDEFKRRLEAIKVPSKDSNQGLVLKKKEAKQNFETLLKEKQEINAKKNAVLDQIKSTQNLLKQKSDSLKNQQAQIGYKTAEEINQKIS